MCRFLTLVFIGIILIISSCKVPTDKECDYPYENISFSDLPTQADFDSAYYALPWTLLPEACISDDDCCLDSLFTSLLSMGFDLTAAWYEPGAAQCGEATVPVTPQFVIHLSTQDPNIEYYGYTHINEILKFPRLILFCRQNQKSVYYHLLRL